MHLNGAVHVVSLPRPRHMFHITTNSESVIEENVDRFGDSYARDVTVSELKNAGPLCMLERRPLMVW